MKLLSTRPLLVLIALAAAGGGWYAWQQKAAQSPELRYKFQEAVVGDVVQSVSANGTLNPVTLVNVGTQVSGTVRRLHVDFNDEVKAGQVLAELDDSLFVAAAGQSEASIASASASLDLAKASEARIRALFADEYVSRQELDQAVQAKKAAEAALRLARAQNDRDRANLGYSVIRSPVSGVVVDRQIDVGQTVAASFQTPVLFKIAEDLTRMQIYTTFAEADVGAIRVGQTARFNVDAFPNRSFRGMVKQIRLNPTTTQNVVTYNVVVEVENPDQILLPGMTAYVNIAVAEKKGALTVPNAALRFRPSAPATKPEGIKANGGSAPAPGEGERRKRRDAASGTVYVLAGGQLKPLAVDIGITDNRVTEIAGGELKAGERVVVGENLPGGAPDAGGFRMRMF
ncbi:MAG: efflux RND transporter periplasmic adaptor subunit [Rhodocyclaceae bacterium]|nr:efflux RND transporter periplasmic adaptor subunit [Rhodocyclaceae bacterium]